jgi:hypothetical protein
LAQLAHKAPLDRLDLKVYQLQDPQAQQVRQVHQEQVEHKDTTALSMTPQTNNLL